MDRIDELVERAIAVAELVMMKEPERLVVAKEFLRRLADELRTYASGHPALEKLDSYVSNKDP
jgi:hypothetical protein